MVLKICILPECECREWALKVQVDDTCIDGFEQDYSISIADALEILQSCTKPSTHSWEQNTNLLYNFRIVI